MSDPTQVVPDIPTTFGALLIGGLFATLLTGYYHIQAIIYFSMYSNDKLRLKLLVIGVWIIDIVHTACIWSALWTYLIDNFGDAMDIDHIHWNLAVSITLTALLTICVHFFFAHRIYMFSKGKWWLVAPIVVIATCRLISASATTGQMLRYGSFARFKDEIEWLFWIGLAFSSTVDVMITGNLFYLLHKNKTGVPTMNAVLDSIILYTFETCSLTTASTVTAMICWLTMPKNLIFMGMHFVIAKLYANSFIITLNTREKIRRVRWQGPSGDRTTTVPVHFLSSGRTKTMTEFDGFEETPSPSGRQLERQSSPIEGKTPALEITVEQTVQYA